MSRLDRHVAAVQSKLFTRRFLDGLGWSSLVAAAAVLLAVVVNFFFRIFVDYLPNFPVKWVLIALAVGCVAFSAIWAVVKRPTREIAAAAIDEKLGLKEKFSTAIYVRPSSDPFAIAAVRDAERTAESVQLSKQFPVPFPRPAYTTMLLAACAFSLANWVEPLNLFAKPVEIAKKQNDAVTQQAAKAALDRAVAAVDSMPQTSPQSEDFRKLVAEIHELAKAPKLDDPARASRRALQALQEVNDQALKEYDKVKKYAEAQANMLQALQPPEDAKGPVGDARKEIAKGNFDKAAEKLEEAIKNFDKMDKQQKEDAAKQMAQAAEQLKKLAEDPNVQQQVQQQLQQMGANQAQAQKMQQLMQQAAQGGQAGQQAAQQLQQQVQQLAQGMNNGQGPNAQQQQALQQAVQQMQAQANAQNQANGLAQAAQNMAQAMQQAQQAGAGQKPQPGGANAQQNQMAQAQQGMQQALNNMNAVKQDLQQLAKNAQQAQNAMQQGQQCANGNCQGGAQGQQGGQPQAGKGQGGQGQFANGQVPPGGQPGGQGGPGLGQGGNTGKVASPFDVKPEQSPSEEIESGRILAAYKVKDQALPGEQRAKMVQIIQKAEKEATDEVDAEHANRQAQKVAQEYFRTMAQEVKK